MDSESEFYQTGKTVSKRLDKTIIYLIPKKTNS
jgi:hypothetical protein